MHDYNPYFVAIFVFLLGGVHAVGGWFCVRLVRWREDVDKDRQFAKENFRTINRDCGLRLKVDD